jgi:hypothetical protein
MASMQRVAIVACLGMNLAAALAAPLIYVDHRRGNNRRDGQTATVEGVRTGPVRTVQAALRRVAPGGRIVILPTSTPYTEMFVVEGNRPWGTPSRPLIIDGGNQEWTGWRPVREEWIHQHDLIYRLDRPTHTFTRLFSADREYPLAHREPVGTRSGREPAESARVETYLFWRGEGLRSPADHSLRANSLPGAIVVDGAAHVVLRNFRFTGYRIDAIQVRGQARQVRIESCDIQCNGRGGIFVGAASEVSIERVRIHDVAQTGITIDPRARVRLSQVSVTQTPQRLSADPEAVILQEEELDSPSPPSMPPLDRSQDDPLPEESDRPKSRK